MVVFLHHIPLPSDSWLNYFSKSGGVGVIFFFVLSGFLITYILLNEKVRKSGIVLKNFLVRRILRIWPLFYALLLFAFLTPFILNFMNISYSNEGDQPNWLMSVLFLENYKMMIEGAFPNVSPLVVMWSVCIEEHFYIVWGLLISFLSLRKIPHLIIASVLVANISRIIYAYYGISPTDLLANADYFAYGAGVAWILIFKPEIIQKLEKINPLIKYLVALIALTLVFGVPNNENDLIRLIAPTFYGIFFSATILFTLPKRNCLKINNSSLFTKLGTYTYGMYLIHTIVINFFLKFQITKYGSEWWFIFAESLLFTIVLSILSYNLFEKQFLKLKKYFY